MDVKNCATSVLFRFHRKYHQINPNLQTLTVFWSEYILKTDAVLDHLPASSCTIFVRSHQHPKSVIVVYGLENSFYKNQAFTARGLESANDTV